MLPVATNFSLQLCSSQGIKLQLGSNAKFSHSKEVQRGPNVLFQAHKGN